MTQAEFIKMVQDSTTNFYWIMVLMIIAMGVVMDHVINKDDKKDEKKGGDHKCG